MKEYIVYGSTFKHIPLHAGWNIHKDHKLSKYFYIAEKQSINRIDLNEFFISTSGPYLFKFITREEYIELKLTDFKSWETQEYFETYSTNHSNKILVSNDPLISNKIPDQLLYDLKFYNITHLNVHFEQDSSIPSSYSFIDNGERITKDFYE